MQPYLILRYLAPQFRVTRSIVQIAAWIGGGGVMSLLCVVL